MKISKATYRRGNVEYKLNSKDLNKKLYNSKYREFLFCPEDGCNAWLSFVERKKNDSSFFRTWSKKKHKEGCPYEVSYNNEDKEGDRIIGEQLTKITDKHIYDKLMRTYEWMIGMKDPVEKPITLIRKIKCRIEKPKGELSLFIKDRNINAGRAPYILTRRYDKLDKNDIDEIRCIFGEIRSMAILNKHAYINLTPKEENGAKIYFSDHFFKNDKFEFDESEFRKLYLLKEYIDYLIRNREAISCCCIGRIRKVDIGYNIHPHKYTGFIINGLGFYDLIRVNG